MISSNKDLNNKKQRSEKIEKKITIYRPKKKYHRNKFKRKEVKEERPRRTRTEHPGRP